MNAVAEVHWDGTALSIELQHNGRRTLCRVPRQTIETMPIYGDFIDREINRHKAEIASRLMSAITRKLTVTNARTIDLQPNDLG